MNQGGIRFQIVGKFILNKIFHLTAWFSKSGYQIESRGRRYDIISCVQPKEYDQDEDQRSKDWETD